MKKEVITPVVDEFVTMIEEIGESTIIGFVFDNAGRQTFMGRNRFSLNDHYKPNIKCLVFDNQTTAGVPYKVYKPIDTIQAILTATDEDRVNIKSGREMLG